MPRYHLLMPGTEVELIDGESLIGRDVPCAIQFRDPNVSRRHASLRVQDSRVTICDLGSLNGTYVNRRRIEPGLEVRLTVGDEIGIGARRIVLDERATPAPDRRRHRRVKYPVPAVYESENVHAEAVCIDISASGLLLATSSTDRPGTECQVRIADAPAALSGRVTRVDTELIEFAGSELNESKLAIEFRAIDTMARHWVEEVVRQGYR